ncbi:MULTISPECIES: nucleoside-diphosphate kinase [unclassified Bacillus (in: firmicutes)]|uniref:nucleoside-diphosphate kinase n=1 Tax=unclassified Bacillus (in: firmicutes) TaxID=185979 RepID=UPI0008E6E531|nr:MULTISPECIES: nucleoside-diphosphate kinase [unclassified Bacillus (in: firmicutes)]SFB26206.1 Nucleoside diphosphate kinase [Bacillus sp. UNCCL13]SFQ91924.1 Nucleoside diphosphate kinase [Bacillus sp. cl95]
MNWNNIGFVICKPDAVYLNLEQEILSFLREKGFEILACKYVTITPDLCRLLYWKGDDHVTGWWWELEAEFFNLGESLCILVQGTTSPPYRSVSELIDQKIKGNNKPEYAKSGTIRRKFGAMNRIFNLFHSSDCTKAAKREAPLFFTDEEFESLANENVSCILKQNENTTLDITDTYFRMKLHCIRVSSMNSNAKQEYLYYINEKHRQSRSVSNTKKQMWLYETLQEENRLFYMDIYENKLLKAITDYRYFKKIDYDALFKVFSKSGVKLTKWERCLLKTTMILLSKNYRV